MKRNIALFLLSLFLPLFLSAQTLNVQVGNVTYLFPAEQTGVMTYSNGTSLTVMNKTFLLSDITAMYVDNTTVKDDTIYVTYNNSSSSIVVAGNVSQYLTIAQKGAHVSISQSNDLTREITYSLSGTSDDGEFYLSGNYKATIEINNLSLTNNSAIYSGAAVHIQNGKRIKIKVVEGYTNTLKDATSGSQKGALYIKGHAEFAQKGTLNIYGNTKHAIKAGEYITIKNTTINILSAVGDGINCSQYFLIESGEININGISSDGLQCDVDDETTGSTGQTDNHEDEDSGNVYIYGGAININMTGASGKGVKAAGEVIITNGTLNVK